MRELLLYQVIQKMLIQATAIIHTYIILLSAINNISNLIIQWKKITPDKNYSNYSVDFPINFNSVYFATAQIVGSNLPNGSVTTSNDVSAFSTPFFATITTTGVSFLKIRAYDYYIFAVGN